MRLVLLRRLLDHHPQLLLQFIRDLAESGQRRFVVGNDALLHELAAGEVVEVVARLHRGVHVLQHLRGWNQSPG